MSIQKLDSWAAKYVQTFPLSVLKDAVVGIDATYYLDLRLNENREESLKQAVGGIPFTFKSIVESDIDAAREAGVTLLFVFNGLTFVNKPDHESNSFSSMKAHENGWKHYLEGDQETSKHDFGRAKFPLELVYRYLRKVLHAKGVEYLVAPYSALAQLAYLSKSSDQHIDAVMSSTDIFLFDIDKVILNWNSLQTSFDWLSKSTCEERLGRVSSALFRDAQLLLGSAFLPAFPMLDRAPTNNKSSISDALALLNGAGRTVLQLCNQYRDDPIVSSLGYADRYKKAVMTIKHHIVLEADGTVEPLDFEHAPGDVHEFVGQRLPEELFFYISRGLISPELPNWLTSGIIPLSLPGGVPDSELYRKLIIEQLNPFRAQALKLVAESLNYYYSNREVNVKTWDNRDTTSLKIELKEFASMKTKASEWKVKQSDLPLSKANQAPNLLSCLSSLKDKTFAQKSITKGRSEHPALRSQDEIISNVFWRFLQARGYIDDKHELTGHGLMLEAALLSLQKTDNAEELAVTAIELLRLGVLNSSNLPGPATPGQGKTTPHTNLISKIACLGRLKHTERAYAGPVNRQLLSYAWMVTAVRASLRNLVEAVLVGMFLNGDVDRNRDDWLDIPQKLPFINDNGSALGVVAKQYLDAVADDTNVDVKKKIKAQEEEKYKRFAHLEHGTLDKSLESAFSLFDAVYAGVQAGGKDAKDIKSFTDANAWLASRR